LLNRFIGAHEGTDKDEFERDLKTTSFLFGGWSWRQSRFYIWHLFYNADEGRYVSSRPTMSHQLGAGQLDPVELAHIGDYQSDFMRRLRSRLGLDRKIEGEPVAPVALDYEPLKALADLLDNPYCTDRKGSLKGLVGGGPQVVKVYPYLRTQTYAVAWNHKRRLVYILRGRVMQHWELFDVPAIDPFSGEVRMPVRGRPDSFDTLNQGYRAN
jgi:hypothetical protein